MWLAERIKNHFKTLKIHCGQVCHATWPSHPQNSHVFITWVNHSLNMAHIHWKSPNRPWIPRITINLSLKPPSSNNFVTWNHHHHQPSLKSPLCHLKAVFFFSSLSLSLSLSLSVCEKVFALSIYVLIYNFTICLLVGSGNKGHNVFVCFCKLLWIVVQVFPMFSVLPMCPCWRELSKPNSIV